VVRLESAELRVVAMKERREAREASATRLAAHAWVASA
jgi:hypothetical protein